MGYFAPDGGAGEDRAGVTTVVTPAETASCQGQAPGAWAGNRPRLLAQVPRPARGAFLSPVRPAPSPESPPRERTGFSGIADDWSRAGDGVAVAISGRAAIAGAAEGEFEVLAADKLLERYRARGADCLADITGTWAVLIEDPVQGKLLLATDRMGRTPVYYRLLEDVLLVATDLERLYESGGGDAIDSQALYHYLYFHMIPADGAIYEGVNKLRAGEMLQVSVDGCRVARYWNPGFASSGAARPPGRELRSCLRTAVARAVEDSGVDGGETAAFLSGGLDSSTVAGMLGELQGAGARACAIGFDVAGYDEMPWARLTARHFGLQLDEYYVTADDLVSCIEPLVAACDEPFGNSSILPAYLCARRASQRGVSTLLAGDGGDELFAGNERYAKQRVFDYYQWLPRRVREQLVEPTTRRLGARGGLFAKAESYVRQATMSVPERLYYYSFLERIEPGSVFADSFLRSLNTRRPMELVDALYATPADASPLDRMLFLDWQVTLADNDLRKVEYACDMAGVAVRFPMLDDEVVALSCRVPSRDKMRGAELRSFYKDAMKGWLAPETLAKPKQGFGLPVGAWLVSHKPFRDMAREWIFRLRRRRIFRDDFLEQVISRQQAGAIAYYGQLVWVLMALEIWLSTHCDDYAHETP